MEKAPVFISDWFFIVMGVLQIVQALALWYLAHKLGQFHRRYEQFRQEGAEMFDETWKVLTDLNMRVTQAGWPPGRLTPRSPTVADNQPLYPPLVTRP